MTPRCPACASDQLRIDVEQSTVKCQACNEHWNWANVEDFSRFFVMADPEHIANADDQAIAWTIDRTIDHIFDLFTPAGCEEIVESIYGSNISVGAKEIFAGQVQDVLAALRAHAIAKIREKRVGIIASLRKHSDRIM